MKQNKGITLIALVVTIIVLIILAGVSINLLLSNNGIITKSRDAKLNYELAANEESAKLKEIEDQIDSLASGTGVKENDLPTKTISELKLAAATVNTTLIDTSGKKLAIVPAGFKIASDSGNTIEEGIVIEDVSAGDSYTQGSQFVWVPVGQELANNKGTITLQRWALEYNTDHSSTYNGNRVYEDENGILDEIKEWDDNSDRYYYYEAKQNETTTNTHAKDIEAFIRSVNTNHGYYIGRYETGIYGETSSTESDKLADETTSKNNTSLHPVVKKNAAVWNCITQPNAAIVAKNMYNSSNFTSDLVNSYAWDTAIDYIEKCGTDSNYALVYDDESHQIELAGGKNDEQCKINDIAKNLAEWTTETSTRGSEPCVLRGSDYAYYDGPTAFRDSFTTTSKGRSIGFRPILYL